LIIKTFGRGKRGLESEKNAVAAEKEGKQ